MPTNHHEGGCLCGDVRYHVNGPLRPVVACYCRQCQKTSGNFVAATAARRGDLQLTGSQNLTWFQSSERARRAFCANCGSSLFWDCADNDQVSIMAGTLDDPNGLETALHIHTASKSAFHSLPEGAISLPAGDEDKQNYPKLD